MRIGLGRRQVVALLVLAPVLVAVSALLELASVARLATERAAIECSLISAGVRRQLELVAQEDPAAALEAAAADPRLQVVLRDAIAQGPTVLHVAVCDPDRVAVAHSMASRAGAWIEPSPPLPRVTNLFESLSAVRSLRRPGREYEHFTPLTMDGRPFASIVVIVTGTFLWHDVQEAFWRGIVVTLVVLSLVIGAGIALIRIVGGMRELEAGVAALREGHFHTPIRESGADEFSRLARELNLLGRQFQRERQEMGAGRTLHRAADLLGEGMLALGADDEIILANTTACRLLGIERGRAVGRRLADVVPAGHPVRGLCERLRSSPERSLSVPIPKVDGRDELVAVGHRIDEPAEPDPGILVEIKSAGDQAALHSLVDQSHVLMHLGKMATGVAHEIRNPLQTLTLDLDAVMTAAGREPDVERHVRSALDKVGRLDRAIRGFLKIARRRPRSREPLDVNGLLEAVRSEVEADVLLAGLELRVDPAPEDAVIEGDAEVLRQSIQNLVRNAIQAQPSRDGRIELRGRRDGERVRISVADTGPGIPEASRDKVFELFYTTREEGTGVGLAIVRQTAEMHGGDVAVESRPGKGTVVTMSLPPCERPTTISRRSS